MHKSCTSCHAFLPATEFYRNGANGLHTSCKACQKVRAKTWRQSNPDRAKAADAEKHARNRDGRLAAMRRYDADNAQRRNELMACYYEQNSDRIKQSAKDYRKRNAGLVRAWNNARRAVERRATPAWADYEAMARMYELAAAMTEERGEPHHVDHIVPLRGKLVSGLHVQDNLRVVTARQNLSKGRKHEE